MFVELFQAVLVHLNGTDVLLLLDVNVRNVQPNITEIGCGFANLCENVACFDDATLVSKNCSDAVCRPDISGVIAEHLLVNLQSFLLVLLLFFLVLCGLVESLQPEIAQCNQRIRVR